MRWNHTVTLPLAKVVSSPSLMQTNRNNIAHGNSNFKPDLRKVIDDNKFLKDFASKIDRHILNYFIKPYTEKIIDHFELLIETKKLKK